MASDKSTAVRHYGVFTRTGPNGDIHLTAHSPADAVKYRFDGWRETEAATADAAPAGGDEDRAGEVAGDSTSTKARTGSK